MEKDTKSMLAMNAKIVAVVEFMIDRFDEIWELPESIRYTFQVEFNAILRVEPELLVEEDVASRESF